MRRVRVTFAILVVTAIVAVGVLSRAVVASPSPMAGLTVAASALVAVVSGALALRILVVLDRRGTGDGP